MKAARPLSWVLLFFLALPTSAEEPAPQRRAGGVSPLTGTAPLTWTGPLDARMRAGVHRWLDRRTAASAARRGRHWNRDLSSAAAYEKSIRPNRERLAKIVGAVDPRIDAPRMLPVGDGDEPAIVAETPTYTIRAVRWPVLAPPEDRVATAEVKQSDWTELQGPKQVDGQGLLLEPKNKRPRGYVVVLPDADQTPEQLAGLRPGVAAESQLARRLVENGFTVVVPTLLSRGKWPVHKGRTNRDWIYRPAFEVGRHPIGYEVQKVRSAVDWCLSEDKKAPVAVAGYGEGGLVALYAAAIDPRIDACLVSGYFGPREKLWTEPLARNVWGLLDEFGDAEIATIVAPRGLVVEYSRGPELSTNTRNAGPARLTTPPFENVKREFARIDELTKPGFGKRVLIHGKDGAAVPFGSPAALKQLAAMLGVAAPMTLSDKLPHDARGTFDPAARQRRLVKQLENFTQLVLRNSEYERDDKILPRLDFSSPEAYRESIKPLRKQLRYEQIGWFDEPPLKEMNPRSRKIYDEEKWTGYEVVLDVWPDVFAWGVLCVPKDLKPGERRPVVVCQHGLEGLPTDTITREGRAYGFYKSFAARLAEQGFVTFAPHNLYRGKTDFRLLQRKANPLKGSLFSIITPQHSRILDFLETLDFVDPERIAFYGLSYGGKTAMRVPALETRYRLSICSGDFNEWVRKNADVHFPFTYSTIGHEWEMPEWDLGHTFNYAEMAYLICPRPFMVERGHRDGVGIDPWIAYEFARARRPYDQLNLGDACAIEYFDGPHTIHLVGTAAFLREHLDWPARNETREGDGTH